MHGLRGSKAVHGVRAAQDHEGWLSHSLQGLSRPAKEGVLSTQQGNAYRKKQSSIRPGTAPWIPKGESRSDEARSAASLWWQMRLLCGDDPWLSYVRPPEQRRCVASSGHWGQWGHVSLAQKERLSAWVPRALLQLQLRYWRVWSLPTPRSDRSSTVQPPGEGQSVRGPVPAMPLSQTNEVRAEESGNHDH